MHNQTDIFDPQWCDIVFTSRNQAYGAYRLRKEYPQTIITALFLALGLLMAPGAALFFQPREKPEDRLKENTEVIDLRLQELIPVSPSQGKHVSPPGKSSSASGFSRPVVARAEPRQENTEKEINGGREGEVLPLTAQEQHTPGNFLQGVEDAGKIYNMAEISVMPSFPGGEAALLRYLSSGIRYPEIAKEAGIAGMVTVIFVIGKSGQVEDIQLGKGIGGGCDEEALRVIRSMPLWAPGKQNGQNVAVRMVIPIRFSLK
jgi:periplasmic protein TonB